MTLFSACILLILLTPCHATSYKWVDDKGVMHFGDAPPKKKGFKNLEELSETGISPGKGTFNSVPTKKEEPEPPLNKVIFEHSDPHNMSEYRITKVTLMKEELNSYHFDIEYIDPEFIQSVRITERATILISADDKNFTSYTNAYLMAGKGKIRVVMGLLSTAPEYLETTELKMMIVYNVRRNGRYQIEPLHKMIMSYKRKWQNHMN